MIKKNKNPVINQIINRKHGPRDFLSWKVVLVLRARSRFPKHMQIIPAPQLSPGPEISRCVCLLNRRRSQGTVNNSLFFYKLLILFPDSRAGSILLFCWIYEEFVAKCRPKRAIHSSVRRDTSSSHEEGPAPCKADERPACLAPPLFFSPFLPPLLLSLL